jgi:hypothetical protein
MPRRILGMVSPLEGGTPPTSSGIPASTTASSDSVQPREKRKPPKCRYTVLAGDVHQHRVGLMSQPQPGQFDHDRAQLGIARLGDTLLVPNRSALPWRGRQAGIGSKWSSVIKMSEQAFRTQNSSKSGRRWASVSGCPTMEMAGRPSFRRDVDLVRHVLQLAAKPRVRRIAIKSSRPISRDLEVADQKGRIVNANVVAALKP